MGNFLVIRFSAMGDVLLLLPVLVAASEHNPDVTFTILTRPKFAVFFEGYPQIEVFEGDVDKEFKGFFGLWKLARILKSKYRFDAILDLHQNLRSAILKVFFLNTKTFALDKGRLAKKQLTQEENKQRGKLPHATERYREVLARAGVAFELLQTNNFNYFKNLPESSLTKEARWIGIAPFGQHKGKIWPFEKIEKLVSEIIKKEPATKILLFGGGKEEVEQLTCLAQKYPNVYSVAGKFTLKEELSLISQLDLMICMDSSNMHMAALAGVKTISIWGATHSDAGFGPYGQSEEKFVEIAVEELPCRPCSVYGNKPCMRKDYACLNRIEVEKVLELI